MKIKILEEIIDLFGEEFERDIWPKMPDSQYGNLESMVLYCFIRKFKPFGTVEMGTEAEGRSSYIIQKALEINEDEGRHFVHVMMDLPFVAEDGFRNLTKSCRCNNIIVSSGVIQQTFPLLNQYLSMDKMNFIFIDADHTDTFAKWYIKNVFPKLNTGTTVHIHDIDLDMKNSTSWPDDSEAKYLWDLKKENKLPLAEVFNIGSLGKLKKYKEIWNKIKTKHPFIGEFNAKELPFGCSASYFSITL